MEVSAKTSNAITEVTPRTRMASWMLNPIFGVDRLPNFLMRDIEKYIDIKPLYDRGWDCVSATIEGKKMGLIRNSKKENVIYYCQREPEGKQLQVTNYSDLAELRAFLVKQCFSGLADLADINITPMCRKAGTIPDDELYGVYVDDEVDDCTAEIDFTTYAPGEEFDLPWSVMYSILSLGTFMNDFPCADSYTASYATTRCSLLIAHVIPNRHYGINEQHTMIFHNEDGPVASVTKMGSNYESYLTIYNQDGFWKLYEDILKSGV